MMCRIIMFVFCVVIAYTMCLTCTNCQGIEDRVKGVQSFVRKNVSNDSSTSVDRRVLQSEGFKKINESTFSEDFEATSLVFKVLTPAQVTGLRVEDSSKPVSYENGVSVILAESEAKIRLFGTGFTENTAIRFTNEEMAEGSVCDDSQSTKSFTVDKDSVTSHSATISVELPLLGKHETEFYICIKEMNDEKPWIHQGSSRWTVLTSYKKFLPIWAHISILVLLLILSGLFSGLNLGLMAMDRTELKIVEKTGTEKERRYAKKITPLRNKGNYLLCSLLLGNVMVNSSLTILLDDLTSGLIAIIGSTLGIVIFGEIIPQAACSRHGLAVGAHTVWVTKLAMALTFPLSFPVSFILDKILGEEIGNVYNRERLRELIKVTENLRKDEVNVIEGVLKLSQSTTGDIMTRLEDVFMLPLTSVLDFDTIDEIAKSGFSRIPVYDGARNNVVSILYTRDLAFVDPDDNMPVKAMCEYHQYQCNYVDERKPLDAMFREFKAGNKGHMAFVRRTTDSETSDPYYEVVGVVTLEDVIEELIQAEISDETDVRDVENRRKKMCGLNEPLRFIGLRNEGAIIVSPQLTFATFQFLSSSITLFNSPMISPNILKRLLRMDVFFKLKVKRSENEESVYIYQKGIPADYFVMILEGRVEASLGKENLVFDGGPFTYFGTQALSPAGVDSPSTERRPSTCDSFHHPPIPPLSFVPDYTVRAVTDSTILKVTRSMYIAALEASTLIERNMSPEKKEEFEERFDKQIGEIILLDGRGSDGLISRRMKPNHVHQAPAPSRNPEYVENEIAISVSSEEGTEESCPDSPKFPAPSNGHQEFAFNEPSVFAVIDERGTKL